MTTQPAHVTRFPARWLSQLTGDTIRAVSLVSDYGRTSGYCFASDTTLARQLGLSRGGINAILRSVDTSTDTGHALIRSRVNTRTGTRSRQMRPVAADELAVCVPAGARDVLPANLFKVYCLLSLREHLEETTPLAQIAIACSINVATARRCVAKLIASGWISRPDAAPGTAFRYLVHRRPQSGVATQLALFPQQQQQSAGPVDEVAAGEVGRSDLQLSLFEIPPPPVDPATAPPGNDTTQTPADSIAQPGSPEQDLGNRRARGGCCSREARTSVPRASRQANDDARNPCAIPSRRHHVPSPTVPLPEDLAEALAPVADLWRQLHHPGTRSRVAAAVRQELALIGGFAGAAHARAVLSERLLRRRQQGATAVNNPTAWLLRRGIPARPGCGDRLCDEGTLITTGERCPRCQENLAAKRAARRRAISQATVTAGTADPCEIRRLAEAQLRQDHEQHQKEQLLRHQRADERRAARDAQLARERAAGAEDEEARLAAPCRHCGRERSEGLCGECADITAREGAVAECVDLVLASSTTMEGQTERQELAARVHRRVTAEIDEVLRNAAAGGATARTLTALGRITAQNLRADYHAGALATMSASPAVIAEGRQAYAASRRSERHLTQAAAEAAAQQAASQAQSRAAQHLLNQRLGTLRRTPGQWNEPPTPPQGLNSGSWTCAYSGCRRLRIGEVPDSGMCPPCERRSGSAGPADATASPRLRAQRAARRALLHGSAA